MSHPPANRPLRALTNGTLLLALLLTSLATPSAVAAPPVQPHLAYLPAHLFVSSSDTDQVLRYHGSSGTFLDVFASGGGLDWPAGLTFGPDGNLYVSSNLTHQVLRYDGASGAFLDVFASGGGLSGPVGLTFGPDGNLYVSSNLTDQVLRYDGATGAFLDVFAAGGGLDGPFGLTFGPDGNLYVSSNLTDQVLRYDGATGAFLDVFASGSGLSGPFGLTFGPDGNLYVSSSSTDEVLRYDGTTGAFLDIFASGGLNGPSDLTFGPDGNLYVANSGTDYVVRFSGNSGAFLDIFASGVGLNGSLGLAFPPLADLSVALDAAPDPAVAGEPLTYALTITNTGPDTAVGVGVTVTLPAQVVYIADTVGCSDPDPSNHLFCPLDPIRPGAQVSFQVRVGVPAGLVAAEPNGMTSITATAEVSGVGGDPDTDNNRSTLATLVTDQADLSVVKTSSPETTVRAGERFTYTIFVENHGPSAARQVTLRDGILSDGGFTLVGVLLDPTRSDSGPSYLPAPPGGVSMEFTLDAPLEPQGAGGDGRWAIQVVVQANEAQQVSNTVQVFTRTGGTPDANSANNQATGFIAVTDVADLTVSKGVLTAGPWRAGTNVQFRLGLTNVGPSAAEGVALQDFLPAGVTLVAYDPPPGASCTAGSPGDPFAPLSCSLGSLPAGAATAMTVTVRINPDFPTGTAPLTNDALASAATFDPDISNNRASASLAVSAEADLSISKQDAPDPATAGEILEYTLTVVNAGPSTARQVEVTDNLPPEAIFLSAAAIGWPTASCAYQAASHTVTCALGDVDPAETVRLLIRVRVHSSTPQGTVLTNSATVSSSVSDPQGGNNQAAATTTVLAQADLTLEKSANPTLVTAGGMVAYTLSVTNNGPSDAPAAVMTDTLPTPLTYEMDNAGCVLIATGPDVVRCSLGGLPASAGRTITLWARVSPAATPGTEPVNTATAASGAADPVPADNTATAAVRIQGQADLRLALFGNPAGTVRAGERLTYTAIVDNLGPGFAHNVALHDLVQSDGSFSLLSVSSDRPAACAPTSGSFTGRLDLHCTLSNPLEVRTPSTAGRWVVTFTVAAAQAQALTSLADVLGTDPDPDLSNNQAMAQHEVSQAADLRMGQVVMGQVQVDGQPGGTFAPQADRVTAGGALTYTLLVTNDGPSVAERVAMQDRLPSWITDVAATPQQGYCTYGTPGDPDRPLTCNLGRLAPGRTAVVTVTARVPSWVAAGRQLYNEALAYSDTFDPDNTNDFAANMTLVDAWADLVVTKVALPPQALPGQVITYTITVHNTGPSDAPSALVSDPPPEGLYAPSWTCTASGGASCTASGSGGIADVASIPSGASVVYTLRATLLSAYPVTNTATAAPLAPVQDPYTENNSAEVSNLIPGGAYLPLVMVSSGGGTPAPDLVIEQLLVTANDIRLVIRNRGSLPVTRSFWVDVYLNPISAPREVNQVWYMLGNQGLVWGVTQPALPLDPGEVLSLSVGDDYYSPGLSQVIWPLLPGTRVYAQVDSYCATTSYGTVLESHEITGEPYNNIIGPVLSP